MTCVGAALRPPCSLRTVLIASL